MGKVIVSRELINGPEYANVLRREVNVFSLDFGLNGDDIWGEVSIAPTLKDIQDIFDEKFDGLLVIS